MKIQLKQINSPWRRLVITLLVNTLLWLSASSRQRAHWVGRRGRRPQYHGLWVIPLLFGGAIFFLEPHDIAVWAAIWGSATAVIVSLYIFYHAVRLRITSQE